MDELSKDKHQFELERKREESRKAFEEHQKRQQEFAALKEQKTKKKKIWIGIVAAVLLIIVAGIAYSVVSPGKYDTFAKCLTEKGAVMYGEDWCQYTNAQKAMFGKSFKHIIYEVRTGLNTRPTWVIDGQTYEKVQSFDRLAELTGCSYN